MSLFPDEDVLTKEIETWRGFIDKLPNDEDKAVLRKLLNNCYEYSVASTNIDRLFEASNNTCREGFPTQAHNG